MVLITVVDRYADLWQVLLDMMAIQSCWSSIDFIVLECYSLNESFQYDLELD